MKKIFVLLAVLVLLFLIITTTSVMAAGDQLTGGTGNGKGYQNTMEHGCEDQPCFFDAPQPGPDF